MFEHKICRSCTWKKHVAGCCLLLYVSAQTSGWARFFAQQLGEAMLNGTDGLPLLSVVVSNIKNPIVQMYITLYTNMSKA